MRTMRRATKRRCARRNKLLADDSWDEAWLAVAGAGDGRAWHGDRARRARERSPRSTSGWRTRPTTNSRAPSIALEGWAAGDLAATLEANRARDAGAGRATEGPHRQDLAVTHRAKQMPAARSSTGEQKALLLGLVLAHAELVAERRGEPPILLLDEVAAHLDPKRRAALFARLEGRGQVWMTGNRSGAVRRHRRRRRASTFSAGSRRDPARGLFSNFALYCTAARGAFTSGVNGLDA